MRVGWIEAVAGGQTCGVEADCERRLSAAPVGAAPHRPGRATWAWPCGRRCLVRLPVAGSISRTFRHRLRAPCGADRGPNDVGGLTTAHLILLSSSPSSPCSLSRTSVQSGRANPLTTHWRAAARFRKRAGLQFCDAEPVLSAGRWLDRGCDPSVSNSDNILQVRPRRR
jgi:hypothetical protein